jgi:hypothetical protein
LKHLSDLIRLCLAFGVLDIDAWIAWPRRLENGVAACVLPRLAKVGHTHFLEVIEADIARFPAHHLQDLFDLCHGYYGAIIDTTRQPRIRPIDPAR